MIQLRLLYLSVCQCARGNSGEGEELFTRFGPNTSQFKHVIKDHKTKPKTRILKSRPSNVSVRISSYHSKTFRPETAATLITRFVQRNILPFHRTYPAPTDITGHKCAAIVG